MRTLAAVTILVVVLVSPSRPGGALAGEDPTEDLEECRELVEKGKWKRALEAYDELFEAHPRAEALVRRRRDVEDDLKLCLFRSTWEEPDADELFGFGVKKFSPRNRRIELSYPDGPDRGLWQTRQSFHDLGIRFEGRIRVRFKTNVPPVLVVLVCFNLENEGGYAITVGGRPAILLAEGGEMTTLRSSWPRSFDHYYEVEIERKNSDIVARYLALREEGSEPSKYSRIRLAARDRTHDGGFLALSGSSPRELEINGTVDKTFFQKLLTDRETKAFAEWAEKEWPGKKAERLPDWLRAPPKDEAKPAAALPLPSDHEGGAAIAELAAGVLEEYDEDRLAVLEKKIAGLPDHTRAFLGVIPALYGGEFARAEKLLDEVLEAEPEFGPAVALRGKVRLHLRHLDAARADLETARKQAPDFCWTWISLIDLAVFTGDLDGAADLVAEVRKRGVSSRLLDRRAAMVHRARRGPLWSTAYDATTLHFRVLSDHSRDLCREVARLLELATNRYRLSFPDLEIPTPKARVYVFSDRQGYLDYGEEKLLGDMSFSAGAYQPALRELLVFLPENRRRFRETLRHEGFHRFLHLYLDDAPIWFNEGSAVYYGVATEVEGAGFTPGAVNPGAIAVLEQVDAAGKLTPLAELTTMPPREFMAKATLHYAQAWALVHFLQSTSNSKYRVLYRRYFAVLREGRSAREAWEEVLKPHEDELERLYREHFREM